MPPALTIAVANLKGGSTKTTTAAFVLHALAEAGLSVLGVDADGENESLLAWSEAGEWAVPVIGLPVSDLHRKLPRNFFVALPAESDDLAALLGTANRRRART